MRTVIANPEVLTTLDPSKIYDTRVVSAKWEKGGMVIILEVLTTEYDPKDPKSLFQLHPFKD